MGALLAWLASLLGGGGSAAAAGAGAAEAAGAASAAAPAVADPAGAAGAAGAASGAASGGGGGFLASLGKLFGQGGAPKSDAGGDLTEGLAKPGFITPITRDAVQSMAAPTAPSWRQNLESALLGPQASGLTGDAKQAALTRARWTTLANLIAHGPRGIVAAPSAYGAAGADASGEITRQQIGSAIGELPPTSDPQEQIARMIGQATGRYKPYRPPAPHVDTYTAGVEGAPPGTRARYSYDKTTGEETQIHEPWSPTPRERQPPAPNALRDEKLRIIAKLKSGQTLEPWEQKFIFPSTDLIDALLGLRGGGAGANPTFKSPGQ
jgi:hypothetical protein